MKKILVIQNDKIVPLGELAPTMTALEVDIEIVQTYKSDAIQQLKKTTNNLDNYHGLIILGGKANAYDDASHPTLKSIMNVFLAFHNNEKPVLGICLGAQLISRALGENFLSNNGLESGFVELKKTEHAKNDSIFNDLSEKCCFFEMHNSFYIPENGVLLMQGDACKNQAFKVGLRTYGIQFHPEMTQELLISLESEIMSSRGCSIKETQDMIYNPDNKNFFKNQKKNADIIIKNWIKLL